MTFNINTNCELCGCYVYYNEEFCEICEKNNKRRKRRKRTKRVFRKIKTG